MSMTASTSSMGSTWPKCSTLLGADDLVLGEVSGGGRRGSRRLGYPGDGWQGKALPEAIVPLQPRGGPDAAC